MSADGDGLYKDLTYKVIGALYEVHNELGSSHKENIYHRAVALELKNREIVYEEEKSLPVLYKGHKIGIYQPDFIIENKVILELKAVPILTKAMLDQAYFYIRGTEYSLVLLVNFLT
jgi:GxxExxY protein